LPIVDVIRGALASITVCATIRRVTEMAAKQSGRMPSITAGDRRSFGCATPPRSSSDKSYIGNDSFGDRRNGVYVVS